MYWPDFRVIGEADGQVKYSGRVDLVREKIRENRDAIGQESRI